jgi:hypothetical protein
MVMENMEEMEHGPVFFEELILDSPMFTTIRTTLIQTFSGDVERCHKFMQKLEEQAKILDWLADRARRLVYGDVEAQRMFTAWLDSNLMTDTPPHPDDHAISNEQSHHSNLAEHLAPHTENASKFPMGSIIDIMMGISYATNGNPKMLHQRLSGMQAMIAKFVSAFCFLNSISISYTRGLEVAETLLISFDEFNKGHELFCSPGLMGGPSHPHNNSGHGNSTLDSDLFLHDMLDMLFEKWKVENPISIWLKYVHEERNNASVLSLSSNVIRVGKELTILADPGKPFEVKKSSQIAGFVGNTGVQANIKHWSSTDVVLEIPEGAISGIVYFGHLLQEKEKKEIELCMHQFSMLLGTAWHATYLSHYPPTGFVYPGYYFEDGRNNVSVLHGPYISSFGVFNAKGGSISGAAVGKGETVTFKWDVFSDDPDSLKISISSNGKAMHSNLPPSGSLRVAVFEKQAFRLHVSDLIDGVISEATDLSFHEESNRLKISPSPVIASVGRADKIWIELPHVNPHANVEITLSTSDNSKILIANHNVTVYAGQSGTQTYIVGNGFGSNPGQPEATITASVPGYGSASVPVYLENFEGQWKNVETELGLVAVHAALMRNGKLLFFSWDEDKTGPEHPGKYQVWDPSTESPGELGMTNRNLFCSGHCFLPDGRLLVAGGASGSSGEYFRGVFGNIEFRDGNRPDRDLHTVRVDINHSTGVNWDKHESMKHPRWYPTCVTLPDGRALLAGGSQTGGGISITNPTYELFDPVEGNKSDAVNLGKDVKLYPFLAVLPDGSPGGTLFVHRHHCSWLRNLATNIWVDKTFNAKLEKSRTYHDQGSYVLLPIRPGQPARILIVGGDGGDEATNTAEIFEFNPEDPMSSKWRSTTNLHNKRFMSDAILLPDGTVLVVNGASRGVASDAWGSVTTPELFDPVTETWTSMTPADHGRHYHSVAILLPDARVLVSGNTKDFNKGDNKKNDKTIQIFNPPYLFRGRQPVINWAPEQKGYDKDLLIATVDAGYTEMNGERPSPDWIGSVALVRAGSVTHSNNMDQRYVELSIIQRDSSSLTVKTPLNGTIAPPGYYMIFILNRKGVPSKGRFIKIG